MQKKKIISSLLFLFLLVVFSVPSYAMEWNISTAYYDNVSFSVAAQDTHPGGHCFKPDGTKVYIVGTATDKIYAYDISTPWLVSTMTYNGENLVLTGGLGLIYSLHCIDSGSKIYVSDGTNDFVQTYSFSTPWNLTTGTLLDSAAIDSQGNPLQVYVMPNESHVFVTTPGNNKLFDFSLTTPGNVSTNSYTGNNYQTDVTPPKAVTSSTFKPTGTNFFVLSGQTSGTIENYAMSTPWSPSSASLTSQTFNVFSQDISMRSFSFKPDGNKMFGVGSSGDSIYSYTLPGVGNSSDPYEISTCGQLQNISLGLTSSYELTNNINCSETLTWNGGLGFDPIAGTFTGKLKGNGFNITNLYINSSTMNDAGLFELLGSGASVANFNLININITAKDRVGPISADTVAGSTIQNISVTGSMSGNLRNGGAVGILDSTSLVNVSTNVNMTASNSKTGGLVGESQGSSNIINSSSTGRITSTDGSCGGITGDSIGGNNLINGSKSSMNISCGNTRVGGLIGNSESSTDMLLNSYFTGNVTSAASDGVGGLVGRLAGLINKSYSSGSVQGVNQVGGLVGELRAAGIVEYSFSSSQSIVGTQEGAIAGTHAGIIRNSYFYNHTGSASSCIFSGGGTVTNCRARTNQTYFYERWNPPMESWSYQLPSTGIWSRKEGALPSYPVLTWEGTGAGMIRASPLHITTCSQLQDIDLNTSDNYQLDNNIDCSATTLWNNGTGFKSITSNFDGHLYGLGFSILNLYVNSSDAYEGIFTNMTTTTNHSVNNLILNNVTIFSNTSFAVGALAATNNAGSFNNITVKNSYIRGDNTTGNNYVGGLFGQSTSSIARNITNITIQNNTIRGNNIGGISGSLVVENTFFKNLFSINNTFYSGGVGTGYSGGIYGTYSACGTSPYFNLTETFSSGNIINGTIVGGLGGRAFCNVTSLNTFAHNNLSATTTLGGLFGEAALGPTFTNLNITNSYSANSQNNSGANDGGLLGRDQFSSIISITSSYYDNQTIGETSNSFGTPKNTSQMKNQSTFVGWDFFSIWGINASINDGYPYLRASLNEVIVPDTTAPNSTLNDTVDLWRTENFTVSISCSDNESGCATTYYQFVESGFFNTPVEVSCPSAGDVSYIPYSGPISINTTTWTVPKLCYYSKDIATNEETPKEFVYGIDKSIPVMSYETNTENNGAFKSQNYIFINLSVLDNLTGGTLINISLYNSTGSLINSTASGGGSSPYDPNNPAITYASVNFTNLLQGLYYYNATYQDNHDTPNTLQPQNIYNATLSTRNITLDTTAPNATQIIPANNTRTNVATQDYNSTVTDNIQLDNGTFRIYNSTGSLINETNQSFIGSTSSTLSKTLTLLDGIYNWFVSLFDRAGNSEVTSNFTIEIDTQTPLGLTSTISPSIAYTNTNLTGTCFATDAGSQPVTYYYQWYVNGTPTATTQNLTENNFIKKNNITLGCVAGDGLQNTTQVNSTVLTISNYVPTVSAPAINSTAPNFNDIISCNGGIFSDGDSVDGETEQSRQFQWWNGTSLLATQTNQTLILNQSGLDTGNVIVCSVRVSDGQNFSNWTNSSNSATIQNTAPTIPTGSFLTGGNYALTTLTATGVGSTDIDNDSITYYYDFRCDSPTGTVLQASSPTNTWFVNKSCAFGHTVNVIIKAYDGVLFSTGNETLVRTILNSNISLIGTDNMSNINLIAGNTTTQNTFINITDLDGDINLTNSSVIFTGPVGNTIVGGNCSIAQFNDTWTYLNCSSSWPYYTVPGIYNITVNISEINGTNITQVNGSVTVNVLDAIYLAINEITFSSSQVGTNDVPANNVTIFNYGNSNYSLIRVTSYNLNYTTNIINATNICINDIDDANSGCDQQSNATIVNITGATLPRGLNSNEVLYPFIDIPLSIPSAQYKSLLPWVITAS